MTRPKGKCPICETRPINGNGKYCGVCFKNMAAQKSQRVVPAKFLTYKGMVVALVPRDVNGERRLLPEALKRDPAKLPKGKTLDLNTYLQGYSRDQIKAFKRCVLQTSQA